MKKPSRGRLHRNITDKCTLICAKVITDTAGQKSVQWRGILANWELSKEVTEGMIARQPERNVSLSTCPHVMYVSAPAHILYQGSWQFMSVNLLSINPTRFSLSDDLESLVLVLIYYGVRYLSSSIQDDHCVAACLDKCFDSYTIGNGKFLCGEGKTDIMKDYGQLVHYLPGKGRTRVFFASPLDGLLATVLKWFRLHYKVLEWKADIARNPTLARAQEHFKTPAKPSRLHNDINAPRRRDDGDAEQELRPAPTSDEKGLALRVLAHSFIINEFSDTVDSALWQGNDRHPDGDRVPKGWSSPLDPVPEYYFSIETA